MDPEPFGGAGADAVFDEGVDAAHAGLDIGVAVPGVDQVDRLVDDDLEAGLVTDPLDAHRLDGDGEPQREGGGTWCGVGGQPEQRRGDAAVELLIVHQGHGFAPTQAPHQLARALKSLGCKQPHAVSKAVLPDHGVNVRIVHGAIGDLAIDAGLNDRCGHQLEIREVARDEHHGSAPRRDRRQPLGALDVHPVRVGHDTVQGRVFGRGAPQFGPLGVQKSVDLGVCSQGEGNSQIPLRNAMRGGQRA